MEAVFCLFHTPVLSCEAENVLKPGNCSYTIIKGSALKLWKLHVIYCTTPVIVLGHDF